MRQELQAGRVGRDQAAFDVWRDEYNQERPHEALEMKMPAEVYCRSDRRFEGTPDDIEYEGADRRKISKPGGSIRYGGEEIFITTALNGWSVGLRPRTDGLIEIWFSKLLLGHLDPGTFAFEPARTGQAQRRGTKTERSVTLNNKCVTYVLNQKCYRCSDLLHPR